METGVDVQSPQARWGRMVSVNYVSEYNMEPFDVEWRLMKGGIQQRYGDMADKFILNGTLTRV